MTPTFGRWSFRSWFPPAVLALLALFSAAGCATIMNGTAQPILVTSDPPGATVDIDGEQQIITPATVMLERRRDHSLTFKMAGYLPQTISVVRSTPAALPTDVLMGGVVGWSVDTASGARSVLSPANVKATLVPTQYALAQPAPGSTPAPASVPAAPTANLPGSFASTGIPTAATVPPGGYYPPTPAATPAIVASPAPTAAAPTTIQPTAIPSTPAAIAAAAAAALPPSAVPALPVDPRLDELESQLTRLAQLRDQKLITPSEYDLLRAKLLASFASTLASPAAAADSEAK